MKFTAAAAVLASGNAEPSSSSMAGFPAHSVISNLRSNDQLLFSQAMSSLSLPSRRDDGDNNHRSLVMDNGSGDGRKRRGGKKPLRDFVDATRASNLRNLVESEQGPLDECDPREADVGVLSCEPGKYCLETRLALSNGLTESHLPPVTDKSLGGVCVQDTAISRNLQGNTTDYTTVIELVYGLCYGNISTDLGLTCDCSGVDVVAYKGRASCTSTPGCVDLFTLPCNTTITACGDRSISYDVTGPYTGTGTDCYSYTLDNTLVGEFVSCTSYVYAGSYIPASCSMTINDVTCSYCVPFNETSYTSFSCNNTAFPVYGDMSAPYDTLRIHALSYLLFNDTFPCPNGCNLCGDDMMYVAGTGNVTVDGLGSIRCDYLHYGGLIGLVPAEQCGPLSEVVIASCNCTMPLPPTVSPAPSASAAPTPVGTDTDSPVAGFPTFTPPGSTPQPGVTAPPATAPTSGTTTIRVQTFSMLGLVTAAVGIVAAVVAGTN